LRFVRLVLVDDRIQPVSLPEIRRDKVLEGKRNHPLAKNFDM
jgi:hypothetical protein